MTNRYIEQEIVKVLQSLNKILMGDSVVRVSTSVTGGKQFQVLSTREGE